MNEQIRPTLRPGSSGAAVAELRDILRKVGCLNDDAVDDTAPPDELVVDATLDTAIRFFQQTQGLKADGIVGRLTWARALEARWTLGERLLLCTPGSLMRGRDVTTLQRRLSDLGFNCGRVDGIFGPRTENGLREFQVNMGLTADGTCGPQAVEALRGLARAITGGRAERLRDSYSFDDQRTGLFGKVIVLDPGHGADDAGSIGHGLVERDVVADIALRVEALLAQQGAVVLLTRSPHVFEGRGMDDESRALFANDQRADAVISLHVDSCETPLANGVAAFYFGGGRAGGHSETGQMLAGALVSAICAVTGLADLRVHAKQWDLLRLTTMPAVRLYIGYLSHLGDAEKLASETFRDVVAQAIAQAVADAFHPRDENTGTVELKDPQGSGVSTPASRLL
jgi:N-acetylmuramoyl-L-alanine amidase